MTEDQNQLTVPLDEARAIMDEQTIETRAAIHGTTDEHARLAGRAE